LGIVDDRTPGEAAMRYGTVFLIMVLAWTTRGWADMGFDDRYERDYNIFNPITRYQPDNSLNPTNAYSSDNPFNPINRYDPNNPANPINQYNPNNPFNPINRYNPENPLNPVNKYNPTVPFAPLNGGKAIGNQGW
jgi:hypothetical protein